MHAEYAWVSSMLATGDAIDVAKCISGGSDRARLKKSEDEKLGVGYNILLEDTFYKNIISSNGMYFILVRNIQAKGHKRYSSRVEVVRMSLSRHKDFYILRDVKKERERERGILFYI